MERELRAIDPTVAIEHVKTLEEIRSESVAPQSFVMRLLVGFSIVASALVLVGVYSVISLSVGSRSREIAIRMAVGAQRRNVLCLVLKEGFKLILVGLVVGTGVAVALARLLGAFLFAVEPTDPATFVELPAGEEILTQHDHRSRDVRRCRDTVHDYRPARLLPPREARGEDRSDGGAPIRMMKMNYEV